MNDKLSADVLPLTIFSILQSFQRTEALKVAIEFDLFTAISDLGLSAEDVAVRCHASARGMRVLCDYLCVVGLLLKRSERYWLTAEAALYLDRRSPQFIAHDALRVCTGGAVADGYQNLAQAVQNGGTVLPRAGTLAPEHPHWPEFARARAPIGAVNARSLATLLGPYPSVPMRVLDIACGHGHYGIAIAQENPLADIFAQDWPAVLEVAVANARDTGVSGRYHTIPGDVFSAPLGESYDLTLVTNFLPDFGPAECERLLARIRLTLRSEGRAVALQWIPDDDRLSPPSAPSLALSLLVSTPNGDVYTYRELEDIFRRAGFARTELRELGPSSPRVVIAHVH